MKIAMMSHYFESHRGGVEIVAGQLARAFTTLGHQVVWMACNTTRPPADPSICVQAIPIPANNVLERRTGIPYPLPILGASKQIDAAIRDADVVLVHDGFYLPCLLAKRRSRRNGKAVVLIQHIGFVPYQSPFLRLAMTALNRMLTRPFLATAAQVVFISEITRRYFSTVRFQRPAMLLFNGVDTSVFAPVASPMDRLALRRALGLDPGRPAILFVGRFVEKKGLVHLEQMARRRPDWDWIVAGWGPIDPNRWRLPNVHVITDRIGPSLTPLYQTADALVLPSVGEGFPLVVQEALACGLPVVCGDDTAMADDAAGAYLAGVRVRLHDPVGTAEAFVAALSSIMGAAGPGEVGRMAMAAFARARYSWAAMALDLVAAFESVEVSALAMGDVATSVDLRTPIGSHEMP